MKFLKWIIFIPVAFLLHYLIIFLLGLIERLITTLGEILTIFDPTGPSIFMNFVTPIIINAIGIYSYFFIGNCIIKYNNENNNLKERKVSNIMLLSVILVISIAFAYLSFQGEEYNTGVVNISNVLASIVVFIAFYKGYEK